MHYLLTRQAVADHPLFDFGADGGEATVDLLIRGLQISPLAQKVEAGEKRKKKN